MSITNRSELAKGLSKLHLLTRLDHLNAVRWYTQVLPALIGFCALFFLSVAIPFLIPIWGYFRDFSNHVTLNQFIVTWAFLGTPLATIGFNLITFHRKSLVQAVFMGTMMLSAWLVMFVDLAICAFPPSGWESQWYNEASPIYRKVVFMSSGVIMVLGMVHTIATASYMAKQEAKAGKACKIPVIEGQRCPESPDWEEIELK